MLIVDADGKLVGIVTTYDSTEYLRRGGKDLMLVEDIEGMLKDMILAAFGVQENAAVASGHEIQATTYTLVTSYMQMWSGIAHPSVCWRRTTL